MAAVAPASLDKTTHDELAVSYAALLLHDEKLEITAANINKVLTAAHVKVEAYWPSLFASAIKGKDISRLLSGAGASSAGPAAPAAAAQTAGATPAATKKEEKKKDEEEEEEAGGAMDLFGGGDDW
mmetsp:Transcript_26473/g.47520  ORF Transcript_26473/g.47520 Transcript_26473/m.47520 type:complete len:126 (+) Transcript_26473:1059-1436(+)|eukprot:CAMPEP_0204898288 /NCGR_PEP_ID=MMETSP1397-20131031/1194_1 /ASSEMBLY_ACC=CAM_ASM_000891 /TAXON_ID=49980 /ORGANISM="Climacostomum Climacostomum virens, Strain Stock W-24" /LENGTH=125 /DNA_ID=CAMNT_0052066111 /DNA_START=1048 /DNA_END=1425 /DNA_ORIENTATION=-